MKPSIERMTSAYEVLANLTEEERDIVLEPYLNTFKNATPPVVVTTNYPTPPSLYGPKRGRRKARKARATRGAGMPRSSRRKLARKVVNKAYKRFGTFRSVGRSLGISEGYARGIHAGRYVPSDNKLAAMIESAA